MRPDPRPELYIGLMSGTSIDSVDAALVDCSAGKFQLLSVHSEAFSAPLQRGIIELCSAGPNEIERMGLVDRQLGILFVSAVERLLAAAGVQRETVTAIGSHGQTIRHRPPDSTRTAIDSFSCQIGDPNTIAENTGITTVADFRRRDIAAGGQGAPLVPLFHRASFAEAGVKRAIVNIGGMANVSTLDGSESMTGYDTGPGNILLDGWIGLHRQLKCDIDGAWAAQGRPIAAVLERLLAHPFFALPPPKSTGREDFNLHWLQELLAQLPQQAPADVQASLLELTARSISAAVIDADEVYICGGGAHNKHLVQRLQALLHPRRVDSTGALGIGPDWVEASAFAWLAQQCLQGRPGNDAGVTGAAGPRVLGAIYHA